MIFLPHILSFFGPTSHLVTLHVTIVPTPPPKWDMNNNVKRLVNRARTLSKLRSNGEEDYEEDWAEIGRMVSAEASEFGLHCYVTVGTFTRRELKSAMVHTARMFLCSKLKSRGAASELLMKSG